MLEYDVQGTPSPKGSVSGYARQRIDGSWYGSVTHTSKSKIWEKSIRDQIGQLEVPLEGPLIVSLAFRVGRPKTVQRDLPAVQPDIDKLARAVLDALKGVISDDRQIVDLLVSKRYADDDLPGVRIKIGRSDGRAVTTGAEFPEYSN